ncbi:MAG: DUF2760 domain-containing protein [Thermogemmata sp.]|nr:DUF2760 domain-containing protein [Gemmataceae bacterium]
MEIFAGLIVGLVLGAFLAVVMFSLRAGGPARLLEALQLAARMHRDPALAERIHRALESPEPVSPSGVSPIALRMLALLQENARLVDFLLEDISAATDAQIGQAVREIHRQAQQVLKEHMVLEPILSAQEGETVTVEAGYDPSAIRVIGHVAGAPPYRGQVEHPGWRAREVKLPDVPQGADPRVVQPAVVHIPEPKA